LYTSGYDGDYIQGLLALLSLTYVKYYTARIMPKMYYRQKKTLISFGEIQEENLIIVF
jgi:hypothetical protein